MPVKVDQDGHDDDDGKKEKLKPILRWEENKLGYAIASKSSNQFCSARRFRTRRLESAAKGEVALEVK